jgi:hypothetical protein
MSDTYHTVWEDEEGTEWDIKVEWIHDGKSSRCSFDEDSAEIVGIYRLEPSDDTWKWESVDSEDMYTDLQLQDLALECLEDMRWGF